MSTALGVVGVAAAILVPLAIAYFGRSRRALSYGLTPRPVVIRDSDHYAEVFEITYDGMKVEDLFIVSLTLENSGNEDIEAKDFDDPAPHFYAGKSARILAVRRVRSKPAELGLDVAPEVDAAGNVHVQPQLLNRGDVVSVDIAIAGYTGTDEPRLEGRIRGVREFKPGYVWKRDGSWRNSWVLALVSMTIGALVAVLAGIGGGVFREEQSYLRVRLTNGDAVCGALEYAGQNRLLFTPKSGGPSRLVPLDAVRDTQREPC